MTIESFIDDDQTSARGTRHEATCPNCGKLLFEVISMRNRGLIRYKCRNPKCRKYVKVKITD